MTVTTESDQSASTSRRSFLSLVGAATLGSLFIPGVPALGAMMNSNINKGTRRISFRNSHTDETFTGVYRVGDKYLPDAFDTINYILRDFRTDEVFPIDPRVIDIVYSVHQMTGQGQPFDIISGYRCPKTNAMLRETGGGGVAKNSLHMTGQAIDLRMRGFSTTRIRDLARQLRAGGVGYYASSDFVHMDSGIIRSW